MEQLINALQQFQNIYEKDDAEGLAADFEIHAGISIEELTESLLGDVELNNECEGEG